MDADLPREHTASEAIRLRALAAEIAAMAGEDSLRLWRTGRKVGRTIYAQMGRAPMDNDPLIGVMDTPELAREAVDAHNAGLSEKRAS